MFPQSVQWCAVVFLWSGATYYLDSVGFILGCFLAMYMLTSQRQRQPGELSAFSVFNPHFQAIPGTMSAADVDASLRTGGPSGMSLPQMGSGKSKEDRVQAVLARRRAYRTQKTVEQHDESETFEDILYEKLIDNSGRSVFKQKPNDLCACASGLKYKRCCALEDREIIPDYH